MTRLKMVSVIAAVLAVACTQPIDIERSADSGVLSVEARITETERDFRDEFAKVSGEVVIKNTDAEIQQYSNAWLWLRSGDETRYRAFLDSVASHHIDVGTVDIKPNDTLELDVYWAVPEAELGKVEGGAFTLEVDPGQRQSKYDRSYTRYVDGKETEVRASEELNSKPTDGLSSRSLEIHTHAIAVFRNPDSDSTKKQYLSVFPGSFDVFLAVFHQDDFSELYMDSYTYLDLFHKLVTEFPRLGVPKYVSLAVEACYDADAPTQFNMNFREIRNRFPDLYEEVASELSEAQLRHIELVDGASIHDWEPEEVMCGYSES